MIYIFLNCAQFLYFTLESRWGSSQRPLTPQEFSSVQFSKNISIAQLSRMSHCAPEATLNPICLLKFIIIIIIINLFSVKINIQIY